MVPFGTIAEPLRRDGRDLARSLGKAVELELRGQETELDRGVLEQVGLELTRAMRADPATAGLPVVVVTSKDGDTDRRLAMEAGADAYLVKADLDRRALLEVVGRLLGLAVHLAGEVSR